MEKVNIMHNPFIHSNYYEKEFLNPLLGLSGNRSVNYFTFS